MHILFPGRFLTQNVGGNTTYARNLQVHLAALGAEVSPISYSSNPVLNVAVESYAGARSTHADLLHWVADTGPIFRGKMPSVLTVHGVASRWISVARNPRQEYVWRKRVQRAISVADRVVTVSNSSARDISEVFGVPKQKLNVIYHGIEPPGPSRVLSEDESTLLTELPRDYLLYVGNLEPRKNLISLIRAVEEFSDVPLLIAGRKAWNFEPIMAEIDKSRSVRYLGFVSDALKQELMTRAVCFVFPSLYEGFGFPVLEAMRLGTPVLTSRRGSLAEVAGPSGAIDDVSPDGIADALQRFLQSEDLLRVAGQEGPAWAQRFSWDESARRHLALYNEVVG